MYIVIVTFSENAHDVVGMPPNNLWSARVCLHGEKMHCI